MHTAMARLTVPPRVKVIEWWHQTDSVVQIQRNFCKHFEVRNTPARKTINRIIRKFSNVATILNIWIKFWSDLSKGKIGRKSTAGSEENMDTVRKGAYAF